MLGFGFGFGLGLGLGFGLGFGLVSTRRTLRGASSLGRGAKSGATTSRNRALVYGEISVEGSGFCTFQEAVEASTVACLGLGIVHRERDRGRDRGRDRDRERVRRARCRPACPP